jgi:rhomboid-like protein
MGNRVLTVLHGRRLQGTLDLDLPSDIARVIPPHSIETALNWLRQSHPVDEDAMITARVEREEREEEEKFNRRAEELSLYKPQSGTYGANIGEADDVYGRSILQEIRIKNEARILAEEEIKRKEWMEGEVKDRENLRRQLEKNKELQKYDVMAIVEGRYLWLTRRRSPGS